MGGNVSGTFADVVLGMIETPILQEQEKSLNIMEYLRCRDDIFIVTEDAKTTKAPASRLNQASTLVFNIEQWGAQRQLPRTHDQESRQIPTHWEIGYFPVPQANEKRSTHPLFNIQTGVNKNFMDKGRTH